LKYSFSGSIFHEEIGALSRAASHVSNSAGVKVVRDAAYVRSFSFRRRTSFVMSLPEVIENRKWWWYELAI
jgi:hypothetical protein